MRQSKWKEFLFLLRREFLFQLDGRRAYPRGVYPGVNWFALLCVAALLLEFNASRLAPERSHTVVDHFTFLVLAQSFLISLRATVYTALSMSRDLQSHTATVVRVSPISRTITLIAKLCACLAPLWLELWLFLPVSLLFFSVYLWLPPMVVFSATPFMMALSVLAGCLGLAIGSTTMIPLQAARQARLFTLFFLLLVPMLKGMTEGWMLPLAGAALWLSVTSRRAPHRHLFLGVFGAVFLSLGLLHQSSLAGFSLSWLHPWHLAGKFYAVGPQSDMTLWPAPTLSLQHPLAMSVFYLALSFIFFLLARARYRHAS